MVKKILNKVQDVSQEILQLPNGQDPSENCCAICLEVHVDLMLFCCRGVYHFNCLLEWRNQSNTCPRCRHPIEPLRQSKPLPPLPSGSNARESRLWRNLMQETLGGPPSLWRSLVEESFSGPPTILSPPPRRGSVRYVGGDFIIDGPFEGARVFHPTAPLDRTSAIFNLEDHSYSLTTTFMTRQEQQENELSLRGRRPPPLTPV